MLLICLEKMNKRISYDGYTHACTIAIWHGMCNVIINVYFEISLEILFIFHSHSLLGNPDIGVKALSEGIKNCKKLKTLW